MPLNKETEPENWGVWSNLFINIILRATLTWLDPIDGSNKSLKNY